LEEKMPEDFDLDINRSPVLMNDLPGEDNLLKANPDKATMAVVDAALGEDIVTNLQKAASTITEDSIKKTLSSMGPKAVEAMVLASYEGLDVKDRVRYDAMADIQSELLKAYDTIRDDGIDTAQIDSVRDYIDFDAWTDRRQISPDNQEKIIAAMEEIYSTPEGRALIQSASAQSRNGRILMNGNPEACAGTSGGSNNGYAEINLGAGMETIKYYSNETGDYHDLTLQRVLFHEMLHIAGDDVGGWGKIDMEQSRVNITNAFMRKYYGEPTRGEYQKHTKDGTKGYDISNNFNKAADLSRPIEQLAPETTREKLVIAAQPLPCQ
jgi:hypothetical protein